MVLTEMSKEGNYPYDSRGSLSYGDQEVVVSKAGQPSGHSVATSAMAGAAPLMPPIVGSMSSPRTIGIFSNHGDSLILGTF